MSLINDIADKIKDWQPSITITAPAEQLKCRNCGRQYTSKGKYDIGICRECEETINAHCIGGEHDGEKAHDQQG